ncbi:MAG: serine/threonine protein phosphatase, partial [Oscillospiraceae bacterium]
MSIFRKKKSSAGNSSAAVVSAPRGAAENLFGEPSMDIVEKELYDRLRETVPIIDAAISKIVRLTGVYRIQCRYERWQELMDSFSGEIPVG